MDGSDQTVAAAWAGGATFAVRGGRRMIARYGELESEYRALRSGAAVVERSDRALLEVTGRDRATWLHNLTTNQVKSLGQNEGVYAFALNVQGRILFDLNVIIREECLWVDLDRVFLAAAKRHFDKYIIMEDVRVADRSEEFVRIGLSGDGCRVVLAELGAPQAGAMPALGLSQATWRDHSMAFFRHDFCGSFGVELLAPRGSAAVIWRDLVGEGRARRATPAGDEAVQVCRIESGIPWPGHEITDEVLPAETRQLERAVSFQKGCYLGQEVVERMRARKVVARLLCGLDVEGDPPAVGAEIRGPDDQRIGSVTSSCRSVGLRRSIALGYVKTASAAVGADVRVVGGDWSSRAKIAALPFVGAAAH